MQRQTRGFLGPGSASHRFALRRVRDTDRLRHHRPWNNGRSHRHALVRPRPGRPGM